MSTVSVKKMAAQLLTLARKMHYEQGMKLINAYVSKHGPVDEIMQQKAFFLYHHAASLLHTKKLTPKMKATIKGKFDEAEMISKQLEKKFRSFSRKNILENSICYNSRLYLAQIYVMTKRYKEAVTASRATYNSRRDSMSAERLGDIYDRSGDSVSAVRWFRKAVQLGNNYTAKLIAQIRIVSCLKEMDKTATIHKEITKLVEYLNLSPDDDNKKELKKKIEELFSDYL